MNSQVYRYAKYTGIKHIRGVWRAFYSWA